MHPFTYFNMFPSWINLKCHKKAVSNKNAPGRSWEYMEAFYEDQARTDYLEQKAKDDAKEEKERLAD